MIFEIKLNESVQGMDDFDTPEDLIAWCYNNVKGTENKDDDVNYYPPKIFINKIGNCFDIAFLIHLFCKIHNIPNIIFTVNTQYINNKRCKTINSNGHVCCAYNKKNKWIVAQTSGINDPDTKLTSCIFEGDKDIHSTIKKFGKMYLSGMNNWMKLKRPNSVLLRSIYHLFTKKQMDQIDERYNAGITEHKQDFIFKLRNEVGPIEIEGLI